MPEFNYDFAKLMETDNVAELLSPDDLAALGQQVLDDYEDDETSREEWLKVRTEAMELAALTRKEKSTPWKGAANMKYPLLSMAAVAFGSEASGVVIKDGSMVAIEVVGNDPDGQKRALSARIEAHMNYQLCDQMTEFLAEHDRLLYVLPVVDMVFKKTYWNPITRLPVSEMYLPADVVVNYYDRNSTDPYRATHKLFLYKNEIAGRIRSGVYRECEALETALKADAETIDDVDRGRDRHLMLEQHTWIDLDGDGIDEPYIVTMHRQTDEVVRIVKRYDGKSVTVNQRGEVVEIDAENYWTAYRMLPSLDGSFYGNGWGGLGSTMSGGINSIMNQLIDAGTLSNRQSGFLSKALRLGHSGAVAFSPGEWKMTSASPEELSRGIYPLPVREPSPTLLNLLTLLIQGGERMLNSTPLQTGVEPAAGTPAATTMAVLREAGKVYTGILKRHFQSLKSEYRKIIRINAKNLDPQMYYGVLDAETGMAAGQVGRGDYEAFKNFDVRPASDMSALTKGHRTIRAQALMAVKDLLPPPLQQDVLVQYLEGIDAPEMARKLKEFNEQMAKNPPPPDPLHLALVKKTLAEAEEMHQQVMRTRMETGNEVEKIKETMARAEKLLAEARQIEREAGMGIPQQNQPQIPTAADMPGMDEPAMQGEGMPPVGGMEQNPPPIAPPNHGMMP